MRRAALLLLFVAGAQAATLAEQVALMPPGTWARIVTTNTPASVDPELDPTANPNHPGPAPWRGATGFKGLFGAWNSGALAPALGPCGSLMFVGGGHGDYFGNEVVKFDICALKWERLSNPYPGPFVWPVTDGAFPNGTPAVPHTYDRLTVAGNKLVMLGAAYNTNTAIDAPTAWVFDTTARKWTGPIQHKGSMEGVSAYDSKRKLAWFQPAARADGEVTSLDIETGAVAYYGKPNIGLLDAMMGYDPVRDRLVMTNFRNSPYKIWERDPGNPALPWLDVAQTDQPAKMHGQNAMAWSPGRKAWIVWDAINGDGQVYELKRGSTGYVWTLLSVTGGYIPPAQSPGTFEKMQLVTVGGSEALVGLPVLSTGVVAFKLPGAVVVPPVEPPTEPVDCLPAEYAHLMPKICPAAVDLCDQPGVFICDHFVDERPGTLNKGFAMPRVEGGELVIEIPSNTGADSGGNYTVTFPPKQFVAMTFRVKIDAAGLAAATNGQKDFILWRGASSCTDLQFAQSHYYRTPVLAPYTDCGAYSPTIPLPGDYLVHYPDYHCLYSDYSRQGIFDRCAIGHADKWEQFYVEIQLPNRITAWHRTESGPWMRYVDTNTYTFHGAGGFDHFMLTAYETGKDPAFAHAPGLKRFDDLALSTESLRAYLGI